MVDSVSGFTPNSVSTTRASQKDNHVLKDYKLRMESFCSGKSTGTYIDG